MQGDTDDALAQRQLVSELIRRQSQLDAEQLAIRRRKLADEQLAARADASAAQLAVQQSVVDQARAMAALKLRQLEELHVRAGIAGVLADGRGGRGAAGRSRQTLPASRTRDG